MGVNFGRLGTVVLRRGGNMVCTPEPLIQQPDFIMDPTPDWTNIAHNIEANTYDYTTQQITGINIPIQLQAKRSNSNPINVYFKIDNSIPSYSTSISPTTYGFTICPNNTIITITNTQYLTFSCIATEVTNVTITVTNTKYEPQEDSFVCSSN